MFANDNNFNIINPLKILSFQLQKYGIQIQNISMQIQNIMMIQNYTVELFNIGTQIMNIGNLISNIEMQNSNIEMPFPNNNIINEKNYEDIYPYIKKEKKILLLLHQIIKLKMLKYQFL